MCGFVHQVCIRRRQTRTANSKEQRKIDRADLYRRLEPRLLSHRRRRKKANRLQLFNLARQRQHENRAHRHPIAASQGIRCVHVITCLWCCTSCQFITHVYYCFVVILTPQVENGTRRCMKRKLSGTTGLKTPGSSGLETSIFSTGMNRSFLCMITLYLPESPCIVD